MLAGQYNVNTPLFQALIPKFGQSSHAQAHGLNEAVFRDLVLEHYIVLGFLEYQYLHITPFFAGTHATVLRHQVVNTALVYFSFSVVKTR